MTDSCLFCGIAAGDIPSVRVAESASTYVDINPADVKSAEQRIAGAIEIPWQPGATGDPELIARLGSRLATRL